MSWLRMDDGMLDHPKWIRALRAGGSDALHLWIRYCAWSSRHLTDGVIPADVEADIAGPRGVKVRAKALQALVDASLIIRQSNGDLLLHDYLDYQPSRAKVLATLDRKAQSERDRRDASRVARHGSAAPPARGSAPSHPLPSPDLSLTQGARVANETEPEPEARDPAPLERVASDDEPTLTGSPATIEFIPKGWEPSEALIGEAIAAGISRDELAEAVTYWRGRHLGAEWLSPEDFFRGKFASIRERAETKRFAKHRERSPPLARASPNPRASKQSNAGLTGFESLSRSKESP